MQRFVWPNFNRLQSCRLGRRGDFCIRAVPIRLDVAGHVPVLDVDTIIARGLGTFRSQADVQKIPLAGRRVLHVRIDVHFLVCILLCSIRVHCGNSLDSAQRLG